MWSAKTYKDLAFLGRLFVILAIISGIAIVFFTGLGMHNIYSRQVIRMAEDESNFLARLLVDRNLDTLISRNDSGDLELRVDPLEIEWLDHSFREFLQPLAIVKVKIFDLETRIVYSSEHDLIGKLNPQNNRLKRALGGELDSHLEVKDQMRDLRQELALKVDVVETYIPIKSTTGKILGAFELYMDVTKFRDEIRSGTMKSLYLLSTVLLLVFLAAYSVGRIGLKRAAEASEQVKRQASIDNLTGTLNRGALMAKAEKEVSRFKRMNDSINNKALSLVMFDIDHFKEVNDKYGHQGGDAVLRELADRIQKQLRPYDVLGRYGGEEFLLLLPSANLAAAAFVAERIRKCVASKPFIFNDHTISVTVSLGVSTITNELQLAGGISLADKALYAAKRNGRNRTEQA